MTFEEFISDKYNLKHPLESTRRFTLKEVNDLVKQYECLKNEELKKRIKDMKYNQE